MPLYNVLSNPHRLTHGYPAGPYPATYTPLGVTRRVVPMRRAPLRGQDNPTFVKHQAENPTS